MWARYPRNIAPAPFLRDVMRERSECPRSLSIVGRTSQKLQEETTESDRPIYAFTYLSTANYYIAASFCNVCFVYITIAI